MKLLLLTTLTSIPMLTSFAASTRPSVAPNILIVNASVHTMDMEQPVAEAVAILGDRIMAVGSSSELRPLAGRGTRVIDAGRNSVFPGFNDSHVHFLMGGF